MPEAQEIEIIGSMDPERAIGRDRVMNVLTVTPEILTHGGQFTGRPGTRILSTADLVVKVREELRYSARDARRFIHGTLERERLLGVHHPQKTWLVITRDDGEAVIANVTPRLQPLHQLGPTSPDTLLGLLGAALDCCIRVGARHELRLDEGLSNFGVAPDGTVYYLDDDAYRWDGFVALGEMLGVWIRQLEGLDAGVAGRLGARLRERVLQEFRDPHAAWVLAENLRGVLAMTERQRTARDACAVALAPPSRQRMRIPDAPRIALLADIHSNLPALRAVMAALAAQGVKAGLVMGDVVGYGPHPLECIEELQRAGFAVVKGNHDHAVSAGVFPPGFSMYGRWAAEWTRGVLRPAAAAWLESLPPYLIENDMMVVHGAPCDRTFFNAYVYSRTYEDSLDNLRERGLRLCFHGHSHVRSVYYDSGGARGFDGSDRLALEGFKHVLVCPGSVGQTRGGVGGVAEYAVLDTAAQRVEFLHAAYDVEETIADMQLRGFPDTLQQRLRMGN